MEFEATATPKAAFSVRQPSFELIDLVALYAFYQRFLDAAKIFAFAQNSVVMPSSCASWIRQQIL
jgi:hypothetical protein